MTLLFSVELFWFIISIYNNININNININIKVSKSQLSMNENVERKSRKKERNVHTLILLQYVYKTIHKDSIF